MKISVRIPVLVDSTGFWQAFECVRGGDSFKQSLGDARDNASELAAHDVATRIVFVEAEIDCPEVPRIVAVQGTVTT